MEKTCMACGGKFTVENGRGKSNAKLCSNKCKRIRKNFLVKKHRAENKEEALQKEKIYRKATKEKRQKYSRDRRNKPEGYVDRFLERAKIRTPDTDLDREFFTDKMDKCNITGRKFKYTNPYDCYHNPFAPSIDRIDSRKGYYKSNVQVILGCVNRMKNDMPNEEFLKLWEALTQ